jgi:hypothetical protein
MGLIKAGAFAGDDKILAALTLGQGSFMLAGVRDTPHSLSLRSGQGNA